MQRLAVALHTFDQRVHVQRRVARGDGASQAGAF
jgi:hypothetical protein